MGSANVVVLCAAAIISIFILVREAVIQGKFWLKKEVEPVTVALVEKCEKSINNADNSRLFISSCSGAGIVGGDLPGEPNELYQECGFSVNDIYNEVVEILKEKKIVKAG